MSTTCSKNWRCFRTDFLPVTVQQDQKHDPLCWHNLYQITQLGIQIQLLPVEVFLKQISKQVVHLLGMFQVSDKPLQEVLMPFLIRHHKSNSESTAPAVHYPVLFRMQKKEGARVTSELERAPTASVSLARCEEPVWRQAALSTGKPAAIETIAPLGAVSK